MDSDVMKPILRELQARDAYCLARSVVRTFECSESAKECFEVGENPENHSDDGDPCQPGED